MARSTLSWPGEDTTLSWLDRLGLNALARGLNPRPLVLAYPCLADGPAAAEGFPLALFKRQLAVLHTSGYRFASMDDFAEAIVRPRPGRLAVIVFDGGLRSTVRLAYPAMRVFGARGILYVSPEHVPAEALPEETGPGARASWCELRGLDPAVLQVGNQGRSNIDCSALGGEPEIEREIWRMGLDIEQQLGYPVRHFACPPGGEGLFDPARLTAFGYASVLLPGAGTMAVSRDPFALRRLAPAWELPRFKAQISGTLNWVERGGAPPASRPAEPARPAPTQEPARARAAAAGARRTSRELGRGDEGGEQAPHRRRGGQSRR